MSSKQNDTNRFLFRQSDARVKSSKGIRRISLNDEERQSISMSMAKDYQQCGGGRRILRKRIGGD